MHWNPLIGRCATRARKDFSNVWFHFHLECIFNLERCTIAQGMVLIGKCMKVWAVQGNTFDFFDDSLSSRRDASNILLHEGICCKLKSPSCENENMSEGKICVLSTDNGGMRTNSPTAAWLPTALDWPWPPIIICIFRLPAREKVCSHWLHLWGEITSFPP